MADNGSIVGDVYLWGAAMTEEALQRAVASYLDVKAKEHGFIWFHCPNSIWTSKSQAGRHKAMGMKAGVPDIIVIMHGGKSIFIELKTATGRLSPAQKEFHTKLNALMAPIYTVFANTANEAVEKTFQILEEHL